MARRLNSIQDKKKIDWKGGFSAMRYIPRFISEIYGAARLPFFTNIFARIITAITPIVILYVGKLLIDEIILQAKSNDPDYQLITIYIIIELGLVVLNDLLNRATTLTDGLTGDLYSNSSSVKIIQKTKDLSISQLEDSKLYDKLERARTQTNGRVNLMSNILSQGQSLILVISLISALIYFEPWLILILTLSIIPAFINELKYSSNKYSLARSWTAERRELDYLRYIGANDSTAKEMKLFNLTDFVAKRFENLSGEYYQISKKLSIRRALLGAFFNLLGSLAYYGAYVLIIYRTVSGVITIGDLTFLSASFNRLKNTLQQNFTRFTRIAESALYLQDYFDFIDIQKENKLRSTIPIPESIQTGFEFKNVSFSYPGSELKVIDNISFELKVGEKMAFVGQNGAGKTTLIKLMLRFYEPTSGTILLDGVDISTFDIQEYQKIFGVIFQDFVRYEFLVKENIAVGNIDKIEDQAAIEEASSLSLADEVVSELKDGMNQQLGRRFARGVNLSGGQWQKIALARAYMKEAEVMVLDEPTSALDARAEYEAFQRFIGLTKGKTSIIISHRFSTVRMADRILVLKDGQILELGTHEQLMDHPKLYAELFALQAKGYK